MRIVNRTLARFKRLQKTDYLALFLLGMLAMVGGLSSACLDIGVTNVFLKNQGLLSIGFDYLWVAVLMMVVGRYSLILERRKGYGATGYMLIGCVALWCLLSVIKTDYQEIVANVLFICKYGLLFLLTKTLWSIGSRVIRLDFTSLRFVGVFVAELVGCAVGGIVSLVLSHNPFVLLWGAFLSIVLFTVILKLISDIFPTTKETFVAHLGGVQNGTEQRLVNGIFILSFCSMVAKILIDVGVYQELVWESADIISVLGWMWVVFGGLGSVLVGITWLVKYRFAYTIALGIDVLCWTAVGVAIGLYLQQDTWIYAAAVLFAISYHLCFNRYLSLLPRPLLPGKGIRIKRVRWLLIEPVAFIFVGAVVMTLNYSQLIWVLLIAAAVVGYVAIVCNYIYSRLLMQMCYVRRWCDGPLMLSHAPLMQMIEQGISQNNVEDVVYFLKILHEGKHPAYMSYLIKSLHHPLTEIRLFCLSELSKLPLDKRAIAQIKNVFQTDPDKRVQNEALDVLICDAAEIRDKAAYETYRPYLKNKILQFGACKGLLNTHNGVKEASKLLAEWADSDSKDKNIMALEIMIDNPRNEWEPWIERFLLSSDKELVVLALRAAGYLGHPKLLLGVLNALDDLETQESAVAALYEYNIRALPSIEKMIFDPKCPLERRKKLVILLGQEQSGYAKQVLLRSLFVPESAIRLVVVQTITNVNMTWIHKNRYKVLRSSIKNDVTQWYSLWNSIQDLLQYQKQEWHSSLDLLIVAMKEEMSLIRTLIIHQIALLNPHALVRHAVQSLLTQNVETYAGSVSCLQDLLPKDIYRLTKNILLNQIDAQKEPVVNQRDMDQYLAGMILTPPSWINAWMQVLVLHAAYALKCESIVPMVKQSLQSSNWLVVDTALWLLGRCVPDKKMAREMALKVPTWYLVQHKFQELVEG